MTDQEGIHRLGLISDRALAPGEEDRFAHDDFVDQLEALIRSGIDTANIALYGSWGAGKSGISRRLADRFTSRWDKKHFHFVELNAFKYADAPLLRAFIYRIAEAAVPGKAEDYHRRLYEHASRSEPTVPSRWRRGLKLAALLVICLSIAVAVLLLALPAGSTYRTALDVVRALAPSAVVVGVLVTVASSVLPSFKAEHETMAPASAEQFEQMFEDLVRKDLGVSGKDDTRLIVFIDELDRCSAGEVARTLETLRTFVNIPGCIFIVAADQQVLEHALTEHVRQSTPADTINPYYSAGSGYLDKIFEYQLSLPSLLPNRLVGFAATLVEGIGGVWSELDELDGVLSVLIPVHVRSPRRVKVLLNRFAMTYEIARKRVAAGSLGDDLPQRAAELAKLVCIRTEFPLFAAELERDTRVIGVIELILRRDEDDDPSVADEQLERVDPELRERAKRIAHGWFAVDELLSRENTPSEDEDDSEPRQAASSTTMTVRRAHAAQLADYLRQTEQVPGPRQDLVNLESIGASFGADPGFAMDLESAALANQTRRVLELMTLAEPEERPLGLLVLAELVRRSRGFDARNVMRSLLRASEGTEDPIEDVAPRLARQLEESGATVGPEEIAGALRLAILGENARLTDELMTRPELIITAAARHCALRLSPRLLVRHRERLGSIAAYEAEYEPGSLAAILGELSDGEATSVIAAAAGDLESGLSRAAQQAEQESEQPDEHEGSARLESLLAVTGGLAEALAAHGHRNAAEHTLLVLVNPTAAPVVAKLDELQEKLAPIVSETVVRALASDLTRRHATRWRELLDHLDRDTLREVFTVELEDELAVQWWTEWQKADEAEATAHSGALEELVALRELQPTGELTGLSENVSAKLGASFTSEDIDLLEHRVRGASMLVGTRLLDGEIVDTLTVSRVGEIVVAELVPPLEPSHLSGQLAEILRGAVGDADEEALNGCGQALRSSTWVPSPSRELMQVLVDNSLPDGSRHSPIGAEDLAALRNDHGSDADEVIAAWLRGAKPAVDEALSVIRPWIDAQAPSVIREAIGAYAATLEPRALTDLATKLTAEALTRRPSRELLADVRYEDAQEDVIAAAIIKLAGEVPNHDGRVVVFELWSALKPVEAAVRKKLLFEVMVPFAAHNHGAYDLVRSRLKLAADPPYGSKQELVDRLLATAPDKKRREQMLRRMEELGLRKRPSRRFGLIPR